MICQQIIRLFLGKKGGCQLPPSKGTWHNYEKVLSKVIRLYLAFDLI